MDKTVDDLVSEVLSAYDETTCDSMEDSVDVLEAVVVEVLSHDGLEELVRRLYENHGVMLP